MVGVSGGVGCITHFILSLRDLTVAIYYYFYAYNVHIKRVPRTFTLSNQNH